MGSRSFSSGACALRETPPSAQAQTDDQRLKGRLENKTLHASADLIRLSAAHEQPCGHLLRLTCFRGTELISNPHASRLKISLLAIGCPLSKLSDERSLGEKLALVSGPLC